MKIALAAAGLALAAGLTTTPADAQPYRHGYYGHAYGGYHQGYHGHRYGYGPRLYGPRYGYRHYGYRGRAYGYGHRYYR